MVSERPRNRTALPLDPADPRPGRVLLADADRGSREASSAALRAAGNLVDPVDDLQVAIERAGRAGVDLVVLDLGSCRAAGLDACRLLKSNASAFLPILLVAGRGDAMAGVEGLRAGADDYVTRPFDDLELTARAAAMIRIKRLTDQMAESRARLELLSITDETTGVFNYRHLQARLTEELRRAERYHEPFACALVAVDPLAAPPSRALGDALLRSTAAVIRGALRDVDLVARHADDELLVVLPSTHFSGSIAVTERIWREARDQAIEVDGRTHRTTVSIGVALYPSRDVRTKDALLRAAGAALDQARRDGGNRVCIFQQQGFIHTPSLVAGPPSRAPESKRAERVRDSAYPPSSRRDPPSSRRDAPPDTLGRKPA